MTKSTTAAVSFVAALGSLVAKGTGNALGPLVTALRAFVSDKSSSDTTTATAAANATATGLCSLVGEHAGARAGSLVSASRGHIFRFRVHDILADDLPLELRYSGMRMEGCLVCSSTEKREARSEKREARSEKRETRKPSLTMSYWKITSFGTNASLPHPSTRFWNKKTKNFITRHYKFKICGKTKKKGGGEGNYSSYPARRACTATVSPSLFFYNTNRSTVALILSYKKLSIFKSRL